MRSIRRNDLQFQCAMGNVPGPIPRWLWCTTHGDYFMLHIDAPCPPFSGTSPFARYRDIRSAVLLRSKQLEAGWTKEPPLTDTLLPMLALPARSAAKFEDQCSHAVRTTQYTKHYECAVRRAPWPDGPGPCKDAPGTLAGNVSTAKLIEASDPFCVLLASFPAGHETHPKQTALS
jgi:hypothetical protein